MVFASIHRAARLRFVRNLSWRLSTPGRGVALLALACGLLPGVANLPASAQQAGERGCSAISLGPDGALNGFVPDPDDAWHKDVSHAPIALNSDDFFDNPEDLGSAPLHPDFGTRYGIPYNVADSSRMPLVKPHIGSYLGESDPAMAPIPANAAVEGMPAACAPVKTDQHMIVIDRATCSDYEFYKASACNGEWTASQESIFDLASGNQRPVTWTSSDASGMSVFEGLIRYDEILAGHIDHAIRFTARATKRGPHGGIFTPPASHAAGLSPTTDNIMGMRVRLKANFDISGYSKTNQIILTAMKKYGMILADNGATMFFQGTEDPRWNDDDLHKLSQVKAYNFEVLKMGPMYDAGNKPRGEAPSISSFKASASSVAAGTPVTLTATMKNASYAFIDQVGFMRNGSIVVKPTQTTRYKLTARNAYGSAAEAVVVEVK